MSQVGENVSVGLGWGNGAVASTVRYSLQNHIYNPGHLPIHGVS
ncbi:MAG: hypothetical protein ABSG36_10455 [Acidimicrobiales bacterium]